MATTTSERQMRIGELAELTGTTPRAIRYYEEIGLLGPAAGRERGKHRAYTEGDLERLREIVRLRDLLGLSLEQLSSLVAAETARAEIRREYHSTDDVRRQRMLLSEALGHLDTQLSLVRERLHQLTALERDLAERRDRLAAKLAAAG